MQGGKITLLSKRITELQKKDAERKANKKGNLFKTVKTIYPCNDS